MNLGPDFPVHVQQPSGEGVILEVYLESRVKCVLVDWKGTNYKCKLGVQANGQWKGRHLTHAGSRKRKLSEGSASLSSRQERLWTQRRFTDAEVLAGNARFAVHRATLCAASPVSQVFLFVFFKINDKFIKLFRSSLIGNYHIVTYCNLWISNVRRSYSR